ncbi:hypothetical protein AP75_11025 [Kaistella haifensis DSM 19056]|uniref:Outer membrane protein beta-barrel domain-containing protein n=1 Tax=Kaistella haifensis DSM 19056 TaxID=1450526 RepID=A0A246B7V8_9FLAO|nr:hypothetical protein [Kaistella haifensis]MDN5577870.1 hypothetical protein [Chryseobacterium sp.]OWK97483.1 hypothetical protein AP75_11025 [Kaistella haifensis DSM 19056]
MKKFFQIIALAFLGINLGFAQETLSTQQIADTTYLGVKPLSKKGQMFVFWGWNRAGFTNSDIRFKGAGYDFTLENVVAHDRPSPLSLDYVNPGSLSIPQFNFRLGYFIKDNLALVIAQDHMKYVMDQDQLADFKGHISDPVYAGMVQNGQVNLADKQFLTFEHTDGLNYINIGLEKYQSLSSKKNVDIVWSYGGGVGMMMPKSNVKLFGNERSDRFHVAGFGADARTNINFIFWKHWMARVEGKVGYINMPDIKTTLNNKPDNAMQDFMFAQVNFGIGYTFNTKK